MCFISGGSGGVLLLRERQAQRPPRPRARGCGARPGAHCAGRGAGGEEGLADGGAGLLHAVPEDPQEVEPRALRSRARQRSRARRRAGIGFQRLKPACRNRFQRLFARTGEREGKGGEAMAINPRFPAQPCASAVISTP
jgi:hypothetical protein